jgi:predicted ATPase
VRPPGARRCSAGDVDRGRRQRQNAAGRTRSAELATTFADGAVFVDLAPVLDAALVTPTIARSLGDIDARGQNSFEAIVESIREQRCLLVLDNFEQLLGAVGIVDACFGLAPEYLSW